MTIDAARGNAVWTSRVVSTILIHYIGDDLASYDGAGICCRTIKSRHFLLLLTVHWCMWLVELRGRGSSNCKLVADDAMDFELAL